MSLFPRMCPAKGYKLPCSRSDCEYGCSMPPDDEPVTPLVLDPICSYCFGAGEVIGHKWVFWSGIVTCRVCKGTGIEPPEGNVEGTSDA